MTHIGKLNPADADRARKAAAKVAKERFRAKARRAGIYSQQAQLCKCDRSKHLGWRDEDWNCLKCGKPIEREAGGAGRDR